MKSEKILLVEDDDIMRITLHDRLRKHGYRVDEAGDGTAALELLDKNRYHLVLSDIRMPGMSGTRLLERIVQRTPETGVILMTAYGSVEDAVACMKMGAADYILKPFDMDDLTIRVERYFELRTIKARCVALEESCRERKTPIIGDSRPIRDLLELVEQVAPAEATILITGESGTGKELVAAAIHEGSRRSRGPYIRINCAAIPEGLMESELFGHEKGAFTGALARKAGKFERADSGTILLDEVAELPLALQAKLLRVLQEREIERVGGSRTIPVDVRILCATAKNLEEEVGKGRFREDLFYRLQVIPLRVPPLRERRQDIPLLAAHFLTEFSRDLNKPLSLADETLALLCAYDFPGNVRELRNIIERVSVLARRPVIEPELLPFDLGPGRQRPHPDDDAGQNLAAAVAAAEIRCIGAALARTAGNRTEAARLLGISRKNLWEKMRLHNL